MKYFFTLSALSAVGATHAQTVVSVGPSIGLNACTAHYAYNRTFTTKYRLGGSAGVLAEARRGHLALQAAVLYQQKGFRLDDEYTSGSDYSRQKDTYRLNYVTLPIQLAYIQHDDGQGAQVFAGGYVGMLLSGRLRYDDYFRDRVSGTYAFKGESKIKPGNTVELNSSDAYSQRFDAGVQAGVGYRYEKLLFQASYGWGLRDLRPQIKTTNGSRFLTPSYYNRMAQLSATYLFGFTK